jgi:predicted permease
MNPGDNARDIDEELAFHRERTVADLVERGFTTAQAEAEADQRFGPAAAHRRRLLRIELRRVRGARRRAAMDVLWTSVRAVVRSFVRSPGFTLGVMAIMALGLGVNAITFGLVDRLILSGPAAVRHPDELRRVVVHRRNRSGAEVATTEVGYLDYRDLLLARQLAGAAGETATPLLFGSGEAAERIQGRLVTANYFTLLGVAPAAGRFFSADESEKDGARVAVLSHAFWQRRFGGSPAVLGQVLPIESHRYTVIGVAPERFTGSAVTRVDVFLPLEAASDEQVEGPWRTNRNFRWMGAIVRVARGISDSAAEDEVTALHRRGYSDVADADPLARIELVPLNAVSGASAASDLSVAALVGTVALLVLLIAFANVANLFLARSLRHHDHVGIRLALGGGRWRLVAEQATQGALLALCGAAAAVVVAIVGAERTTSILFPDVAWVESSVNLRLLLALAACAIAGGACAAALPMWQASRSDLIQWLRTGGHRVSRTHSQAVLLVVQGALSVLLLVGAGLFVRSLGEAQSIDLGIDVERLMVVSMLRGDAPPRPDLRAALRENIQKIPGVERTTAAAGTLPFVSSWAVQLAVPGLPEKPRVEDGGPYIAAVEPGYFETAGTSIVEGRPFDARDRDGAPRVAIVNRTMARLYWPGDTAIGKCLTIGSKNPTCSTVVGVVENTRRQEIVEGDSLLYYIPIEQADADLRGGRVIVRLASSDFTTMTRVAETIRRDALRLEPSLRYVSARALDDVISPQLRAWRLGAGLFSAFGLLALVVAAVGLYSVVAFDVEGRRREIGVRAALGASSAAILRLVVGDGLRLATRGVLIGLVLASASAPLLRNLLYGITPWDPAVFAGAAAVLAAAALVASAVPALRAAAIEPSQALRDE